MNERNTEKKGVNDIIEEQIVSTNTYDTEILNNEIDIKTIYSEDFDINDKIKKYTQLKSKSCSNLELEINENNFVVNLENTFENNLENEINWKNLKEDEKLIEININNFNNTEHFVDKLYIYSVTWNMFGKSASKTEIQNLLPKYDRNNTNFHHIYTIGTEECMRSILTSFFYDDKSQWERLAQDHLGPDYILIKAENMYAIHLMIFVHFSIFNEISKIGSHSVKTGFYNIGGNKGGVAIWFNYKHISLMFINCHLAAGQTLSNKRNSDFERILTNIQFNKNLQQSEFKYKLNSAFNLFGSKQITSNIDTDLIDISKVFDVTIFMGDFNYRIDHDIFYVSECIKHNNIKAMVIHDQMNKEIKEGRLNHREFKEGEIRFQPTYKLVPGSDKYHMGKDKIPGWTDRILFKCQNLKNNKIELNLLEYNWIKEIQLSDHKPVKGIFELKVTKSSSE